MLRRENLKSYEEKLDINLNINFLISNYENVETCGVYWI
jgi:hypothetical protein